MDEPLAWDIRRYDAVKHSEFLESLSPGPQERAGEPKSTIVEICGFTRQARADRTKG